MQVSNTNDHVTHAVIGANKTIDFAISNDAEFFHILSSTLYKNQPLAVVREVICNAWDAHIDAEKTTLPIEITINNDALIIEDFGLGIPHDLMGPTYGTYGASTKKKDKRSTGGFGLGCKAPFAYTDYFEVENKNQKVHTLYAISKSSAEVSGKPGITSIVTFPTEKSGLKVTIPIKNIDDVRIFTQHIMSVIQEGGILANVNGKRVATIDYDMVETNFLFTKHPIQQQSRILIRYGNVLYPVETHEKYAYEYSHIMQFIKGIEQRQGNYSSYSYNNSNWRFIFIAEPDSISIVPSREALSMQDHTITTLTNMLKKFWDDIQKEVPGTKESIFQESITKAFNQGKTGAIFDSIESINFPDPPYGVAETRAIKHGTGNIATVVREHIRQTFRYTSTDYLKKESILPRLDALIKHNWGDTKLIKSYRAEFTKIKDSGVKSNWFQKKIVYPIVYKLKAKGLKPDNLLVYTHKSTRFGEDIGYVTASKANMKSITKAFPYIKKYIVLSHNRAGIIENLPNAISSLYKHFGRWQEFLAYIVPRTGTYAADASKIFEELGYTVIDLTAEQEKEYARTKRLMSEDTVRIVRPRGLKTLQTLITPSGNVDYNLEEVDGTKRIKSPVAVMRRKGRFHTPDIDRLTHEARKLVNHLFGSKIGICTTDAQLKKYADLGIPEFSEYLLATVINYVNESEAIQKYFAFDYSRLGMSDKSESYMKLVYSDETLRKKFDICDELTGDDLDYFNLWKQLAESYVYRYKTDRDVMVKKIDKIPTDPKVKLLIGKIEKARKTTLSIICGSTTELLLNSTADAKVQDSIRNLFLTAMEG